MLHTKYVCDFSVLIYNEYLFKNDDAQHDMASAATAAPTIASQAIQTPSAKRTKKKSH